jgi:hypothetical protein
VTYAAFRTSDKFYYSRPPANCPAARLAWDIHAKDGPIISMRLLDGLWFCKRTADGDLEDVDAVWVNQCLDDPEMRQKALA